MTKRLSRLVAILTMLQSKRILTAQEIATRFEISLRSAYRDLDALQDAGVPLTSQPGVGFSLVKGYVLPPINLSENEANALILAEKLLDQNSDISLLHDFRDAIEKVKAVMNSTQLEKVEFLSQRIAPSKHKLNSTSTSSLSAIQMALSNQIRLHIKYLSLSKNEVTQRTIEPMALYFTQDHWILVGYCLLRLDFRDFRVDKIQEMEETSQKCKPRQFSLAEYLGSFA